MNLAEAFDLVVGLAAGGCYARVETGPAERFAAPRAAGNDRALILLRPEARIIFFGPTGEHSLDVYASDEARVRAHWDGFAHPLAATGGAR